ncbi:MAG: endonuclease domain-containing protein [Phenylobacterium sp.]|nr:MAG: endonuclease domain-containing protein [Phenylobacterium sp.]
MVQVRTVRAAKLLDHARSMRREPTRAEARLWNALRGHRLGGWKWRRQAPLGPFIVDFLCNHARLIVELDGTAHADNGLYDIDRTLRLQRFGFRVLRFSNEAVLADLGGVCADILRACGGDVRRPSANVAGSAPPSPRPLPLGEGHRTRE